MCSLRTEISTNRYSIVATTHPARIHLYSIKLWFDKTSSEAHVIAERMKRLEIEAFH